MLRALMLVEAQAAERAGHRLDPAQAYGQPT